MNNSINIDGLTRLLQDNLYEAINTKSVDELKTLDWLTYETDFFLENKYKKAS